MESFPYASLSRSALGIVAPFAVNHPRFQPLVDQPTYHSVFHLQIQKAIQVLMVDRLEVVTHICIVNAAHLTLETAFPEHTQRLMRTAIRPGVFAGPKARLFAGEFYNK